MPTREDELVRDTERTRADLASDLEALGDRVAPKKVVARGKAKATETVEELGEKMRPGRILKRPTDVVRDRLQSVRQSAPARGRRQVDSGQRSMAGDAQRRPLAQRPGLVPRSVAGQVRAVRSPKQPSKTSTVARPVVAGVVVVGAGVLIARLMRSSGQDDASEAGGGVAPGGSRSGREGGLEPARRATKAPAQAQQDLGTSAQRTKRPAASGASTTARRRRTAATEPAQTATKATSSAGDAGRMAPSRAAPRTAKPGKARAQGASGAVKAQVKRPSPTVKPAAKRPARATKAPGAR